MAAGEALRACKRRWTVAKKAWLVVMAVVGAMALAGCTRNSKPRYFSEPEEAAMADAFMKLPTPEGAKEPAVALAIVADAGTGRYLLLRVRMVGKDVEGTQSWPLRETTDPWLGKLGKPYDWLALKNDTGDLAVLPCEEGRDSKFSTSPALGLIMLLTLSHMDRFAGAYAYPQLVRDDPTTPGGKVIIQMVGFRSETLPARVRARVDVGKLLFGTEIRVEQTVQEGWLDVLPLSQFVSDPLR